MDPEKKLKEFIRNGEKHYLPHISIDCAIFGYHGHQLKILLTRWKNIRGWCLPGGYILRSESTDRAAGRILVERTGLSDVFLQQYHTFGQLGRGREHYFEDEKVVRSFWFNKLARGSWLDTRTVSIGYYALVDFSKAHPRPDDFSEECRWWDIHNLPELLFDHDQMIRLSLRTLRIHLSFQPIGLNLLPRQFTLPELQRLYETILDKKLDWRNFQKKILHTGILRALNRQRNIGPHRPPNLYSFDKVKYKKLLAEGIGIFS